jgi:phosphate-selective porin
VVIHGRVLGSRLRYEAGYFDRDGDNARTDQAAGANNTVVGRVVVRPLAGRPGAWASTLHFGAAVAGSRVEDRLGVRGRTLLEDGVFFERLFVNGRRLRTGVEAYCAAGPASIGAEYMTLSDERLEMGFHREALPAVRAHAWYVAGTWAVTGEKKDGRLEPGRKMGALEVVGRIEQLRFDDVEHPGIPLGFPASSALRANGDLASTAGVNWYVTRFLRVQYNHVFEKISDIQRSPAPAHGGRLTTGLLRVQVTI